jgi:hypothetical protein
MHHIVQLSDEGPDTLPNLIALCPTCHALYHRGTIREESIRVWKAILVSLGQAFDKESVEVLLFLYELREMTAPIVSGDTIMKYSKVVAAGLVQFSASYYEDGSMWGFFAPESKSVSSAQRSPFLGYTMSLTEKGKVLVEAWRKGDRQSLSSILIATRMGEPGDGKVIPSN